MNCGGWFIKVRVDTKSGLEPYAPRYPSSWCDARSGVDVELKRFEWYGGGGLLNRIICNWCDKPSTPIKFALCSATKCCWYIGFVVCVTSGYFCCNWCPKMASVIAVAWWTSGWLPEYELMFVSGKTNRNRSQHTLNESNAQIFICTHLIDTFVERLFRNRVRVDSRARMPSIVLVRGVYYCYSNPSMKCFVFGHCSTMYSNRLAASCCCGVWIRSAPVYNLVRRHFVVVVD